MRFIPLIVMGLFAANIVHRLTLSPEEKFVIVMKEAHSVEKEQAEVQTRADTLLNDMNKVIDENLTPKQLAYLRSKS